MMQVVPRWKVSFWFAPDSTVPTVMWLDESHLGNVLHDVAKLKFDANGLRQPCKVTIEQELQPTNSVTSYTAPG